MTVGLALFVKTPGRSPVKSRLWPAIGREAAEALYRDCAMAGAEVAVALQHAGRLQAYWAIAEPDDAALPCPWQGLPRLWQGDGSLGERMARIYETLRARHGAALLVGTDVPQASEALFRSAIDALDDGADVVIGPGEDGGFWLVGGRAPVPLGAWTAPRYSTPNAYGDFLAGLPTGLQVDIAPTLRDLDEGGDLLAVAAAMAALSERTPTQARVMHRLDALCATMPR